MTAKQKVDKDKILKGAAEEAQKWLDAFTTDGKADKKIIREELQKREFEGERCKAWVVDGPEEAAAKILEIVTDYVRRKKEHKDEVDLKKLVRAKLSELRPHQCIWDYYLMAFYESAYHQLPTQNHPFMKHSLFRAFKHGLGHMINLGNVLIGVVRPEAYRDDNMRLHKADGPAIIWGSYRSWWWHGQSVPQKFVEQTDKLDLEDFKSTSNNMEQRRAFCEILGWERVLKLIGSKRIQRDDYGELLEAQLDDDDGKPARFAFVKCPSTARQYVLRVPPDTKTCRAALAWSAEMKPSEYEFKLET